MRACVLITVSLCVFGGGVFCGAWEMEVKVDTVEGDLGLVSERSFAEAEAVVSGTGQLGLVAKEEAPEPRFVPAVQSGTSVYLHSALLDVSVGGSDTGRHAGQLRLHVVDDRKEFFRVVEDLRLGSELWEREREPRARGMLVSVGDLDLGQAFEQSPQEMLQQLGEPQAAGLGAGGRQAALGAEQAWDPFGFGLVQERIVRGTVW